MRLAAVASAENATNQQHRRAEGWPATAGSATSVDGPANRMADALPAPAREHPAVLWRGWPLARALAILVPLLQILSLLWLIWARTPDVPVGDEWDTAVLVHAVRQGSVRWGDFWAFHSEHRILVPRVVNLTLIQLTRWNRQIAMTFDLAVVAVTAAFLLGCLRRAAQGTGAVLALGVPCSLLLFSPSHYENWLAPFQLAFLGTVFGAACCLWALTTQPRGARGLSLALLGALVATLSSLNGLMVWIAFLPNVRRAGYRRTLVWGCVALAAALAYAIGFTGGGKVASPLPDLLGYALGYLGAPVGYPTLWLAQLAGLLSLALVCANLCVHALLRRDPTPLGAWLGLAVFALACTVLTTLGRGPSLGVEMALTSRYQIFGALWWVATQAIAWLAVAPAPRRAASWWWWTIPSISRRSMASNAPK
jgi:hypothetical protein